MSPGPLEADYERWRQHGDLDALAAVFDAVAPELLRVARHLLPDEAAAEDLLQTTFLAVLRQPQRFRAGARLVPWLVGILSKQALKHRRKVARGLGPVPTPDKTERAPDDRLADHELTAAVQQALSQLREPYASVVRAHLQDGARPVELAARMQCAPGTIRMQLSRGLAMLRGALPFGLALPLIVRRAEAIARVRDVVLARAVALPAATITTTWLATLLMPKALTAFALAALLAVGWCVWLADPATPLTAPVDATGASRGVVASATSASTQEPRIDALANAAAATPGAAADGDRAAAAPIATPGVWLVGNVTSTLPATGAPIVVHVGIWGQGLTAQSEVQADGSYRIELTALLAPPRSEVGVIYGLLGAPGASLPSGSHTLHVLATHECCMPKSAVPTIDASDWQPGQRREVRQDFHLVAASVITGRVDVANESMGTQVAVFELTRFAGRVAEPNATSGVDTQGRFELRSEAAGEVELWFHHPVERAQAVRAMAVLGQRTDVGVIRLDAPRVELVGQLEVPDDLRGGATLHLHRRAQATGTHCDTTFQSLARVDGRVFETSRAAETDEHGAFAFRGIEAGAWQLRLWSLAGVPLFPEDRGVTVEAPAAGLRIGGGRHVIAVVVLGNQGPLANVNVVVVAGDATITLPTDEAGRVRWFGSDVDYTVRIEHVGYAPFAAPLRAAEHTLAPETRIALQTAATATLALTITDAATKVERHVDLSLRDHPGNRVVYEQRMAIPDGPLVLENLPAGSFRLRLQPTTALGFPPVVSGIPTAKVELDVVLHAGKRTDVHAVRPVVGRLRIEATFDVPPDQARGRIEVVDQRGVKVATTTVIDLPDGWREGAGALDLRGANLIRPDLPVGFYTVVTDCGSAGRRRHDIEIRAGETTTLPLRP